MSPSPTPARARPRPRPRSVALTLARALALALALPACGSDGSGPANTIPAELAATWTASPACRPQCGFTFISVANPADSLNFTALGAITRFTLNTSGGFTFDPGLPTIDGISGRMRLEPGTLVVQPTNEFPEEERIDYLLLTPDRLRLDWRETITYTLEPGQPAQTVHIRAVLER